MPGDIHSHTVAVPGLASSANPGQDSAYVLVISQLTREIRPSLIISEQSLALGQDKGNIFKLEAGTTTGKQEGSRKVGKSNSSNKSRHSLALSHSTKSIKRHKNGALQG